MTSEKAFDLCLKLMNTIKDKAEKEHEFYRLGEDCFNNKVFMEEKERDLSAIFGQDYKRIRYHHLVRLGGDITRSGFAEFPKATVLGAFLWNANHSI
jgi:hypothetical protein